MFLLLQGRSGNGRGGGQSRRRTVRSVVPHPRPGSDKPGFVWNLSDPKDLGGIEGADDR